MQRLSTRSANAEVIQASYISQLSTLSANAEVIPASTVVMQVIQAYLNSNFTLGHHSLIPSFLSHKELLVHAGGRLLLLFIILIK